MFSLAFISLLFFSGCSDNKKGHLIDSAIKGVKYTTDSTSGDTDKDGTFSYGPKDKTITFSLGNLIIVKDFDLSTINSDGIILPADIAGVDRTNISNGKIMKLIRVLQSLDNDNNPSNGINIDEDTKGYLNTKVNIVNTDMVMLKKIVTDAKKVFKSQKMAKEHYINTLSSMGITPVVMPFITVWKTDLPDENITIVTSPKYTYDYTIDWGDGTIDNNVDGSLTHTYINSGKHTVKISGDFPHIDAEGKNKLLLITQWGDITWKSFSHSFDSCGRLDVTAKDTPDLSAGPDLRYMFGSTKILKGNESFNNWDVSNVTIMYAMFFNTRKFNQPLNNWDVSNVTNFSNMFFRTKLFNQPLDNWDMSSVKNMRGMFGGARRFNQPLNNWDVSNVRYMDSLFSVAKKFNQPLDNWNVSNVTSMGYMFDEASAFKEQDLSSWDVSKVKNRRNFMRDAGNGNIQPNWK